MKIKLNIKSLLEYISVIISTAMMITLVLIALPLTENISERTSFNLNTKTSQYWSKEYILTLQTTDKKEIETSRDILYKRLRNFGVEKAKIVNVDSGDEERQLRVIITTSQKEESVKELIINPFDIQIVTRRDDVDFFDENNQYAYLFASNYNETQWSREDFRNVYINELRTSDNNYSNFAIYKIWLNKKSDFDDFLKENKGEYIGVSIDGFVTPYLVPFDDQSIFAIPISSNDKEQIKVIDLLYNSGIVPTSYTLASEDYFETDIIQIDHLKISIGILISFVLTYAYIIIIKQSDLNTILRSFLSTVLVISAYLTILKLSQIPVDTFLLPISAILGMIFVRTIVSNRDSSLIIETSLLVILALIILLGSVYMGIFSRHLILLVLLGEISYHISGWYIDNVRRIA